MGKPLGTYTDPVFDRIGRVGPLADWLGCTAMAVVFAALFGWMIAMIPVATLWPGFGKNNASQFWPVYLTCVAVWVVPISAWAGIAIWRDVRSGRRAA
jgi:hypothetical protein